MPENRGFLSIGEVLSLLKDEFPDVTISKIRFLESQGLIDPERTPSGYRKFYDPDIDRLRWILRQQRENFLPLKVIKGRLSEEGVPDPAVIEDAVPDVLATPEAKGFDLSAWLIPGALVAAFALGVTLLARRWRRTPEPAAAAEAEELDPADQRRLDAELTAFDR